MTLSGDPRKQGRHFFQGTYRVTFFYRPFDFFFPELIFHRRFDLEFTKRDVLDFHLYTTEQFILIPVKQINPKEKAAIVTAGTFGLVGAGILAVVGNPVAWGALAYATYRVAKSAYSNAQSSSSSRKKEDPDRDLFI